MAKEICHDCGVLEGGIHVFGCDMENCPFCGRQLISCDCCYKKLGIDISVGTWAYKHGLTNSQLKEWMSILSVKGRIPYVQPRLICARCGKLWPKFFKVPDYQWRKYIVPELRREVLCWHCFLELKDIFPQGWRRATP